MVGTALKQIAKRHLPRQIRYQLQMLRSRITAPPSEDANLHPYTIIRDTSENARLSLVIPTIEPAAAFGGILTGLDLFLELGQRSGAELRLVLDDLGPDPDTSVLVKHAQKAGMDPAKIEVLPRREHAPRLQLRSKDVFLTYNWWVTLNIQKVVATQAGMFGAEPVPYIYLIQDYEPQFYPFSSSHMMARLALDTRIPYWAVYNSSELQRFCESQGHAPTRSFVFEPRLSDSLRPFLKASDVPKRKQLLVYGRPNVPRNCFPAIRRGLSAWIASDPNHASWDIISAGMPHKPVPLAGGRVIRSLGKLSLEEYGQLLQETAVGLSLMSSPHPSYPPLEMAHFGILTITNSYANKDLSVAHDNIVSVQDIAEETLGAALKDACTKFAGDPKRGWLAETHMPSFFREETFECLDDIVQHLQQVAWQ